jgi:ABC-type transporter Mla subunit MlaD
MVGQIGDLLTVVDQEVKTGDVHQAIANANVLLTNLNTQLQRSDLPGAVTTVRNLAGGPRTQDILTQLDQTVAQLSRVSAALPALVAQSQATITQADETTADLQAQLTPVVGCLIPALYPNRW